MLEQIISARGFFTIGHSNHSAEHFRDLLKQHDVEVLVDVRSQPYSQYSPHFNRDSLQSDVTAFGVRYLFMGEELGGRPPEPDCYDDDGHVLYSTLSTIPRFLKGIDRITTGVERFRVALMCSEEDPTVCHRFLLVARVLADRGVAPLHIRGDGRLETHADLTGGGKRSQLLLFPDAKEESPWRSLRSVLPKHQPQTSSESFANTESDDWSMSD